MLKSVRPARRSRIVAALLASALASAAQAAPPAGFDQRVEQLRQTLGVPGVSIAIVEDGRPTLAKGWGVQEIGTDRPVGADTIFATGSTGKAFTVAALAVLVDQGKLRWDDKLIDHMPDFRMYDPWVTRELTIRDLLVHRSGLGLGAGDLLFVPNSNLTRKEIVRRLRHIKPASSFRYTYAYDNLLYIVAGQLIEDVSGLTWEQFIRQHIYQPLGMSRSTVSDAELQAAQDRGRPHARLDGPIRGIGKQVRLDETVGISPAAGPAGGLAISANDMTKWLMVQLGRGQLPGTATRVFSEQNAVQMWTPVTLQPIASLPPELKPLEPRFRTYALGWDVSDYRGAKIISHGGAVFGSLTTVVLIPERNVAFSVAVNSEEGQLVRGLMYELLDHYLGLPKGNWPEKYHAFRKARTEQALKQISSDAAKPAKSSPSLPLARYAGEYVDPWYGKITVSSTPQGLAIRFPHSQGMSGALEHWQYNTFRTRFEDKSIEPAFVTFGIDADGKIERVTMKAASPLADFSYDYQDLLFTPASSGK